MNHVVGNGVPDAIAVIMLHTVDGLDATLGYLMLTPKMHNDGYKALQLLAHDDVVGLDNLPPRHPILRAELILYEALPFVQPSCPLIDSEDGQHHFTDVDQASLTFCPLKHSTTKTLPAKPIVKVNLVYVLNWSHLLQLFILRLKLKGKKAENSASMSFARLLLLSLCLLQLVLEMTLE